jgi:hypothetical protein
MKIAMIVMGFVLLVVTGIGAEALFIQDMQVDAINNQIAGSKKLIANFEERCVTPQDSTEWEARVLFDVHSLELHCVLRRLHTP